MKRPVCASVLTLTMIICSLSFSLAAEPAMPRDFDQCLAAINTKLNSLNANYVQQIRATSTNTQLSPLDVMILLKQSLRNFEFESRQYCLIDTTEDENVKIRTDIPECAGELQLNTSDVLQWRTQCDGQVDGQVDRFQVLLRSLMIERTNRTRTYVLASAMNALTARLHTMNETLLFLTKQLFDVVSQIKYVQTSKVSTAGGN